MTRTAWIVIVLVALLAFFAGWRMAMRAAAIQPAAIGAQGEAARADSSAPYSAAQLERWIKGLSAPNDVERALAEKELADAGVYAESALKAAQPAALHGAQEAIQRLLDRQRFVTLSDLDYPTAVPHDAAGYIYANDVSATLDDLNNTALARLWQLPALDALRPQLLDALTQPLEGERQPPYPYLKRQLALTVFANAPMGGRKLGLFIELIGADPQGDYYDWVQTDLKNGGSIFHYKNIECVDAGTGRGAHTRTGRNIIFASDTNALKKLIDGVLENRGIGASEGAKRVSESLGKRGIRAVLDIPGVLQRFKDVDPASEGLIEAVLSSAVIGKLGHAGFSSTCYKRGFEDRLVCLLPEGPHGIAAALTVPAGGHAPIELLDSVPAMALAAGIGYLDGGMLEQSLTETLTAIRSLDKAERKPGDGVDLVRLLRELEQRMGVSSGKLMSHVKGEAGFWAVLRPGLPADTVDVAALLTAPTAEAAAELGDLIEKYCNTISLATVSRTTVRGRTLRELKALFFLLTPNWSFNWAVDGKHVYLATSPRLLEQHLNNLERNAPGLLTRAAFSNALGEFSAEERRGSVLYADSQTLLTIASLAYMQKARTDPNASPEVKKIFDALPPVATLFADVPPLVAFTVTRPDRGEIILHSPIPVAPLLAIGALNSARNAARAANSSTNPSGTK